ncbi:MAG TPA: metallophosphoesterase family protein [Balneolaceae bacterium]|nr:metallophosphoesterase family protein [Balneolaceae bacterium]
MTNPQKIVAIGDIHGCLKSLEAIWKKLEPYKEYKHVFIGDYIDRGPSSKEVVDFLLKVKNERECIFIRGNHEQMLLDAVDRDQIKLWLMNGGRSTLESYNSAEDNIRIPDEHLYFYRNTELFYDTKDYFFAHAGAPPDQKIEDSIEDSEVSDYFLWGRDHIGLFGTVWEKTVVFGHTPRSHPIRKDNMIGIDTGCVYNELGYGKLTAVLLPEEEFIQQLSLD